MTYVMGLDAAKTRPATDAERAEMAPPAESKVWTPDSAGSRFSASASIPAQADFDGSPMVTDTMCDEDILNLARVLAERDEGFIEITQATGHIKDDLAFVEKLAADREAPDPLPGDHREPQQPRHPSQEPAMGRADAREGSADFRPGAAPSAAASPSRLSIGTSTMSPPAWRDMLTGTKEEKIAKMKDPAIREAVKSERAMRALDKNAPGIGGQTAAPHRAMGREQARTREVRRQIARPDCAGRRQASGRCDGRSLARHRSQGRIPAARAAVQRRVQRRDHQQFEFTFPGVSDGGAHTKFFTGGAFTTDFLRWMVRDEQKVTLEEAHYRLSALPAHAAGFRDRGILREGAAADVVVYDLNGSASSRSGSAKSRTICRAANGAGCSARRAIARSSSTALETFTEDKCTGATPGKLLRHGHA